ncbi:hypothetical protein ACWCXC_05645 [Streptomyces sp. NPDC001515]
MQRTRITVNILVGVAVTALSGCVSVEPRPSPPVPSETRHPAQDLAPQIVRPPVRDTLGAVTGPKPSATRTAPRRAAPPQVRHDPPRLPRQHRTRPERAIPRRVAPPVPAPALPRPVAGSDVCALGRGYGHWPAGSPQSRICDDTYGH